MKYCTKAFIAVFIGILHGCLHAAQLEMSMAVGQRVFSQCSAAALCDTLQEKALIDRAKELEGACRQYDLCSALASLVPGVFTHQGLTEKPVLTPETRYHLEQFYRAMDTDMLQCLQLLQTYGVMQAATSEREAALVRRGRMREVIEKDTVLLRLLLARDSEEDQDVALHTFANRAFEFCFSARSVERYLQLLCNPQSHAAIRLLHAVIWDAFVMRGWHEWDVDCLKRLAEQHAAGKRVVYLFGGVDIHTLLAHGIYNVDIVDPMLPSQHRFYPQNWEFFIQGQDGADGVGDEIRCPMQDGKGTLLLRRTAVQHEPDQIMVIASGDTITIPRVTSTWQVFDEAGNQVGTTTFQRRLITRDDVHCPKHASVIPFNELNVMVLPTLLGGGMVEVKDLPATCQLFVTQLGKPVDKAVLCNLRLAHLLNETDLQFFQLVAPIY